MNTTQCGRARRAAMSHGCTTRLPAVACTAAMALCCTALGQPDWDTKGRWDPPEQCGLQQYEWVDNAISAIHLPSGEVLFWRTSGSSNYVWTAASGCFTSVSTLENLFCSGHVALSDGSILVAGGKHADHNVHGIDQVMIYRLGGSAPNPWDNTVDQMNHARWYPTCTALPDGTVLAISGTDGDANLVDIPEIYDPGADQWLDMAGTAAKLIPLYPFMFVLPDGNVFYAGAHGGALANDTFILNLEDENWDGPIMSNLVARHGSAVMYEPGKVLKCGGQDLLFGVPFALTEMIDLSDPNNLPTEWDTDFLWDMFTARRDHNLVLLADGTILAVGGSDGPVGNPVAIFEAELFDPNEGFPTWQRMAIMEKKRMHHSTALLLPDATVLAAGEPDDPFPTAEIFSPAYLFKAGGGDADRPLIGYAPTVVLYGTSFSVILSTASPVQADAIKKVSFVRLAAVTHGFDQDQRYVPLEFDLAPGQFFTLIVDAPADANLAPPGYYMLFLISDDGVPSIAKYVKLIHPPDPQGP